MLQYPLKCNYSIDHKLSGQFFLSVHFRGHYKSFNIMLKYHYNHTYNLLNKLITQG